MTDEVLMLTLLRFSTAVSEFHVDVCGDWKTFPNAPSSPKSARIRGSNMPVLQTTVIESRKDHPLVLKVVNTLGGSYRLKSP